MARVTPFVRSGTTSVPPSASWASQEGGDVPCAGGHDDRVERAVAGRAVLAVAGRHADPVAVAGGLQGGAGPCGHLGVDVEGDDVAARGGDLGDNCGVVPGGADFQDPRAGSDAGLGDHAGLEPRAADRGQGDTVGVLLVPHDVPAVALFQRGAGPGERVPGDRPERGLDLRGGD